MAGKKKPTEFLRQVCKGNQEERIINYKRQNVYGCQKEKRDKLRTTNCRYQNQTN